MDRHCLGVFCRVVGNKMNKSVEAMETNANGTIGYKIKSGKNRGKVLKHLKTDKNQL